MRLMKILQLVENHISDVDDANWEQSRVFRNNPDFKTKIASRRSLDPKRRFVGAGEYTYVDRKDDEHELDKVERVSAYEKDGGNIYYKQIVSDHMVNKFLPRVRAIDDMSFEVERLVPFQQFSNNGPILSAVVSDILGKDVNIRSAREFAEYLNGAITNRNASDEFKEAIQFIQRVRLQNGLMLDININNVMFRMTGNMPQLVFVDPLMNPSVVRR